MFKFVVFLLFLNAVRAEDKMKLADPPKPSEAAAMARYIMHKSDWVSLATISVQESIKGYPFVSLKSVSDGEEISTGIPYLYLTSMDVSGADIEENKNVTIMATLAQSDYCKTKDYDPQDPRCAKLIISGRIMKPNSPSEYDLAMKSLFARHPVMKTWPKGHNFYPAKVYIQQIEVLDQFGGIIHVTAEDYFKANVTEYMLRRAPITVKVI